MFYPYPRGYSRKNGYNGLDLAQLAKKVPQIEQLRVEKERLKRGFKCEKIAYVACDESEEDFDESKIHVTKL